MFLDEAVILLQSGDGGNGIVAFRREKYVPYGGPSGGSGGRGGDIIFKIDTGMRTLINFSNNKIYKANNGGNGQNKNKHGKDADDLIINIPQGTLIYDYDNNELLGELINKDEELLILKGGRGGRGNKAFSTSNNPAPHMCENGEPGIVKKVKLELRLLSDVGIIGKPSAGKSTLISTISNANSKIGDYDFTTLSPKLGIVKVGSESFVAADLPGLIKGASLGKGLGYKFLKHIQRTKILWHLIDLSPEKNQYKDYLDINNELSNYSNWLMEKQQIIIATKIDIPGSEERLEKFRKKIGKNIEIIPISSFNNKGLNILKQKTLNILNIIENEELIKNKIKKDNDDVVIYNLDNYKSKMNKTKYNIDFKIIKINENNYKVESDFIIKKYKMTNKNYYESLVNFTSFLHKIGVYKKLEELGVTTEDNIYIGDDKVDLLE